MQHHVPVLSASTWSTAPAMQGNITVCLLGAGIKRFRVEKFGKYRFLHDQEANWMLSNWGNTLSEDKVQT